MASTLSLVKGATALATAGLANLHNDDDLISYDSLVKARGLLDLIFELPSFEMELGRYSASLELCGSILNRSIRRRRHALEKKPPVRTRGHNIPSQSTSSSSGGQAAEHKNCSFAGAAPVGSPTRSMSTMPTAWEPDEALTFDSLVGNAAAKRALFEHVVLPLKLSEEARGSLFVGLRSSGNNVLLHGPPGTGKTTIAQAASQEAGAAFYSVAPSSILSKYQGESERVLHQLFDDAKKTKPSVIFLDELDALAPSRDAQDDVQTRRLLAEILLQTSQLRPKDQVVIIAATNRMDDIDIALLRRFHSRVFVGPPNHKERMDMIVSFMEGIEHSLDSTQISVLADRVSEWSGSDIKVVYVIGSARSLCREACMGPVRSLYEHERDLEKVFSRQPPGGGAVALRPVEMSDCDTAYRTLMGSSVSLNQDQGHHQVLETEELVGDELIGEADGQTEERGVREELACTERGSQQGFVDEAASEMGD